MQYRLRNPEVTDLGLLMLAALYFCHRFYGVYFPIEGDAPLHLYYRLNEGLMAADYNPYHWYYFTWLPATGFLSPIHRLAVILVKGLAFWTDDITRAFLTNILLSATLLFAVSSGVYFWLRRNDRKRASSILGAITVTYTGYHLVGVYEFDHMYLISLACVAPTLICFSKITKSSKPARWAAAGALSIGLSLLGGTNTPLFFYLPFFLLLPFLANTKQSWSARLEQIGWQISAIAGGILVGAATVLPGAVYVGDTIRGKMRFSYGIPSLTVTEKLQTLFLRDWAKLKGWHYHETDYFIGLPILILATFGIYKVVRDRREKAISPTVKLLAICLVAGILLSHFTHWPEILRIPFSFFFEALSIRHTNRLFILALLPIAYFSARGFDEFRGRVALGVTLGLACLNLLLIHFYLLPAFDRVIPDLRMAAILGLGAALLATVLLTWRALPQTHTESRTPYLTTAIVGIVFAMYAWAPPQSTRYAIRLADEPDKLAKLPDERLDMDALLGGRWNYSHIIESARASLTEPPKELAEETTKQGRVVDTKEIGRERTNYFAPQTGHRFAFSAPTDVASSQRIFELIEMGNPNLIDLNATCWVMTEASREAGIPEKRRGCFPEAIFTAGAYLAPNEEKLREWLKTASLDDLRNKVGLDCSQINCAGWLSDPKLDASRVNVTPLPSPADRLSYKIQALSDGYFFASIPYRFDWSAEVNGQPAPLLRANYAFMAVPVKAGESTVTLSLSHRVTYLAVLISVLATLAASAIVGKAWRKSRRL